MNKKELKKYIFALQQDINDYRNVIRTLHKRNKKFVFNDRRFYENIKYIQFIEENLPQTQLDAIKLLYLKSMEHSND